MMNELEEQLWKAVCKKDEAGVAFFIQVGARGNQLNSSGLTPLIQAIHLNNEEIIHFLIANSCGINVPDKDGTTPLILAIKKNKINIVKALLENGADINAVDKKGSSVLSFALKNEKILSLLVAYGIDINMQNEEQAAPIIKTIKSLQNIQFDLLLKFGADVNATDITGESVLSVAFRTKNKKIINKLLDAGACFSKNDDINKIFWQALKMRNYRVMKAALDAGADINMSDTNGNIPLLYAVSSNNLELVQFLAYQGADINKQDEHNNSATVIAIKRNPEIAKFLIDFGADIHILNNKNKTLLIQAVKYNRADIVCRLIQKNIDTNARDNEGYSALYYAVLNKNNEILRLLLSTDIKIDMATLKLAASKRSKELMDLLLGSENNLSENDDTLLHWASRTGDIKLLSYLIEKGADINLRNSQGSTPLHWACSQGHKEMAFYLIEKGADVNLQNIDGQTPLHWASSKGYTEIIQKLIQYHADVNISNDRGYTALHWAVRNPQNTASVFHLLIQAGADIEKLNHENNAPLLVATRAGNLEAVKTLLKAKADPNTFDDKGNTPLIIATMYGHNDIIKFLISAGADIEQTNEFGNTPLMNSIIKRHTQTSDILINAGANIHAYDIKGNTPLILAVKYKCPDIVLSLINKKADINEPNCLGNTPLLTALFNYDISMVKLLLALGADKDMKTRASKRPETIIDLSRARLEISLAEYEELHDLFTTEGKIQELKDSFKTAQKKKNLLQFLSCLYQCAFPSVQAESVQSEIIKRTPVLSSVSFAEQHKHTRE